VLPQTLNWISGAALWQGKDGKKGWTLTVFETDDTNEIMNLCNNKIIQMTIKTMDFVKKLNNCTLNNYFP